MRKFIAVLMVILGWGTLVLRLKLRIETEDVSPLESIIRFFSYFTILTNILVTVYFTVLVFDKKKQGLFYKPGTLTAITSFIMFVGVIYHLLLRSLWDPQGMVMVFDEIHHTIAPLITLIFWFLYEDKKQVILKPVLLWLLYPISYIIWALVRGSMSSFYPYYFLDINTLGLQAVIINSLGLFLVISLFLVVFWFLGKQLGRFGKPAL